MKLLGHSWHYWRHSWHSWRHSWHQSLLLIESLVTVFYKDNIYWDGIPWANSVDPDQTAPKEQSDQGLHCLPFQPIILWWIYIFWNWCVESVGETMEGGMFPKIESSYSNISMSREDPHQTVGWAMKKCVFGHMRTVKPQISLHICPVWSGPLLSANRTIGHNRMYQWRANARMRFCACLGYIWICAFCTSSKTHIFTYCGPCVCMPSFFAYS